MEGMFNAKQTMHNVQGKKVKIHQDLTLTEHGTRNSEPEINFATELVSASATPPFPLHRSNEDQEGFFRFAWC